MTLAWSMDCKLLALMICGRDNSGSTTHSRSTTHHDRQSRWFITRMPLTQSVGNITRAGFCAATRTAGNGNGLAPLAHTLVFHGVIKLPQCVDVRLSRQTAA